MSGKKGAVPVVYFAALIIVVTAGVFFLLQPKAMKSTPAESEVSKPLPVEHPASAPITADEVERALETSPEFRSLPQDARILITFFDGNGAERSDVAFFVGGGPDVIPVLPSYSGYDIKLSTGDYYVPRFKTTTDVCALLRGIKEKKDFLAVVKTDLFTAQTKYGSLSKCVPFP